MLALVASRFNLPRPQQSMDFVVQVSFSSWSWRALSSDQRGPNLPKFWAIIQEGCESFLQICWVSAAKRSGNQAVGAATFFIRIQGDAIVSGLGLE